jgi:hypothetical protein
VQVLEKQGYSCHVWFGMKELLRFYVQENKITQTEYDHILDYIGGNPK